METANGLVPIGSEDRDDQVLSDDEQALAILRDILLAPYRELVEQLEADLEKSKQTLKLLENQINDEQALIDTVTPIIADSIRATIADSQDEMANVFKPIIADTIRRNISESKDEMVAVLNPIIADTIQSSVSESQDEMVEALYPITLQLVRRSVSEAIQDLTRKIDQQMRNTFSLRTIRQRIQAKTKGVSDAEFILREALPFDIQEIFLIHQETGILLAHYEIGASSESEVDPDSEIIGGMLTAIQDFVQDAFGRDDDRRAEGDQLGEVRYGSQHIMIEPAQQVYIAIVTTGVKPRGFRERMREYVYAIEREHSDHLRDFEGDTSLFNSARTQLISLVEPYVESNQKSETSSELSPSNPPVKPAKKIAPRKKESNRQAKQPVTPKESKEDERRSTLLGRIYRDSVDPNLAFLAIFSRDCRDFGVIYSDFGYRKQPISYLKIAQI
ncbi:hypothetical protein KFU94_64805 [Chloroflexi bacterium TSY]|nr:hypothetical protein [Chloroflexi bacterium TSY]